MKDLTFPIRAENAQREFCVLRLCRYRRRTRVRFAGRFDDIPKSDCVVSFHDGMDEFLCRPFRTWSTFAFGRKQGAVFALDQHSVDTQ